MSSGDEEVVRYSQLDAQTTLVLFELQKDGLAIEVEGVEVPPYRRLLTSRERLALLSVRSSRQNKLWLAVTWKQTEGAFVEVRWQGRPRESRLLFQFEPAGNWLRARSYDEDIAPFLFTWRSE